jgi:hypothetical protein
MQRAARAGLTDAQGVQTQQPSRHRTSIPKRPT